MSLPVAHTGPLPTELYLHILPLLDPTTYVAFAQTCRFFRSIAVVEKHHLAARLLCLELDPAHGGTIPVFNAQGNVTHPAFDDAAWDQLRFACTSCLRIRHVRHFQNHYVFRLPYRKPELAAPPPRAEPGNARRRWHARRSAAAADVDAPPGRDPIDQWRSHAVRRRYVVQELFPGRPSLSALHHPNGLTPDEDARVQQRVAGSQRHRRECLDCHGARHRHHSLDTATSHWRLRARLGYMIMGRPDFCVNSPDVNSPATSFLMFRCVRCEGWDVDPAAFSYWGQLKWLMFEWDFAMPVPWWRTSRAWVCGACEQVERLVAAGWM